MCSANAKREQLIRDGFCVAPKVLSGEMLENLRRETDVLLDGLTAEQKQQSGGQGSILAMPYVPSVFADLVCWQPALGGAY